MALSLRWPACVLLVGISFGCGENTTVVQPPDSTATNRAETMALLARATSIAETAMVAMETNEATELLGTWVPRFGLGSGTLADAVGKTFRYDSASARYVVDSSAAPPDRVRFLLPGPGSYVDLIPTSGTGDSVVQVAAVIGEQTRVRHQAKLVQFVPWSGSRPQVRIVSSGDFTTGTRSGTLALDDRRDAFWTSPGQYSAVDFDYRVTLPGLGTVQLSGGRFGPLDLIGDDVSGSVARVAFASGNAGADSTVVEVQDSMLACVQQGPGTIKVNGAMTFSIPYLGGFVDAKGDTVHSDTLSTLWGLLGHCHQGGLDSRWPKVTGVLIQPASFVFGTEAAAGAGIRVTVASQGTALDPDGYQLVLDDTLQQLVGVNDSVSFKGLAGGKHRIEVGGVSRNCVVVGFNPQYVTVGYGQAAVSVQVRCGDADVRVGQVAYTECCWHVVLADADGSPPLVLTQGRDPVWSPDGQRLAFAGPQENALSVINADGRGVTTVTTMATGTRLYTPVWSPDGGRIAYLASETSGASRLYIITPDGSPVADFSTGSSLYDPAWSPDGQWLVFEDLIGNVLGNSSDIYVVGRDGSGARHLTDGGLSGTPVWSPDGAKLAFARRSSLTLAAVDSVDLYVMNADGSGPTNLTNAPGNSNGDPAWSPTGEWIAFDRSTGIHAIAPDGSGLKRVVEGTRPVWSPDAGLIAFLSYRDGVNHVAEIYLTDITGTWATRLSHTQWGVDLNYESRARWRPGAR